jgi:hypothetical protein
MKRSAIQALLVLVGASIPDYREMKKKSEDFELGEVF